MTFPNPQIDMGHQKQILPGQQFWVLDGVDFEDFVRRLDRRAWRVLTFRRTRALNRADQYASAKDFCSAFDQDMDVLYWLALTLTSDERKAEQCFVGGLDECIEGNSVFKEWARSWSRRVVIKNAIRMISPRPGMAIASSGSSSGEKLGLPTQPALAALTHLQPFDRFVFVMSVLEGYADRDCAALLACSPSELAGARLRAFRQIQREIELCAIPIDDPVKEHRENVVLRNTAVA